MEKKVIKKRRINWQKIFCFVSFIFILVCIIWYGGRFIYFYQGSKKTITEESTTFARVLKTTNNEKEYFKKVGKDFYFYGDVDNNYVSYSNFLWRIVKVNNDNTIVLVTDNIVGTLAYGQDIDKYNDSNIMSWLNSKDNNTTSGIFEAFLNNKEKYLVKNSSCIDTVDDISNVTCEKRDENTYLGLLSLYDYIYTGNVKSFISNGKYTYLANRNKDGEIWYMNDEGKVNVSLGEDIFGIKATITLSPTLDVKSGNGSKDNPYRFEDEVGLMGSYVKLDNDIWRIYEENDGIISLMLQDVIVDKDKKKLSHIYSNNSYYHNDTKKNSLAYYLNHTYYEELSYKDLIVNSTYVNGFYGKDNKYQYQEIDKKKIETKVSLPSIHNIIFDDTIDGYFTNTGISEHSSMVYIHREKGVISSRNVLLEANVIPCIRIQRDKLKVGTGSSDDPYRTE